MAHRMMKRAPVLLISKSWSRWSLQGTGIGEGVITLRDVDRDGDLDIVDTQAIYAVTTLQFIQE